VDEGVVEGGLDVADTEHVAGVLGVGADLGWTVVGDLCFLNGGFTGGFSFLCFGLKVKLEISKGAQKPPCSIFSVQDQNTINHHSVCSLAATRYQDHDTTFSQS
jgi:hypothetical protein